MRLEPLSWLVLVGYQLIKKGLSLGNLQADKEASLDSACAPSSAGQNMPTLPAPPAHGQQ